MKEYIEIEEAPAVDVAPIVHGKWLEKFHIIPMYGDKQMRGSFKTCSICGFILVGESYIKMNYCPNCGAKMDEEVDEDK